jgi:hypothetical protein
MKGLGLGDRGLRGVATALRDAHGEPGRVTGHGRRLNAFGDSVGEHLDALIRIKGNSIRERKGVPSYLGEVDVVPDWEKDDRPISKLTSDQGIKLTSWPLLGKESSAQDDYAVATASETVVDAPREVITNL